MVLWIASFLAKTTMNDDYETMTTKTTTKLDCFVPRKDDV